jgi:hypothetical protein
VAYDARHAVWLVSSLTLLEAGGVHGNAVVTSRSTNGGLTWSNPSTTATGGDLDKNWIVCDNTSTSPFYGRCYTEWDNHGAGNLLQMSTSTDGGQHWSAPATNNTGVIGGQPLVRPNGTVIVPIANANETAVGAFHSTNGGASWSAVTTIATIRHHGVAGGLREGPLPSAEIDGAGRSTSRGRTVASACPTGRMTSCSATRSTRPAPPGPPLSASQSTGPTVQSTTSSPASP